MDPGLVLGTAVAVFCTRDAFLLGARPRLLVAYLPILGLVAVACGLIAERLSIQRATELVEDPRLLLSAAAVHAALAFRAGRRSRAARLPDWFSLLPVPVVWVAMTGAARFALARWDVATGLQAGLAIGTVYGAASGLIAASGVTRRIAAAPLRFSAVAHISALLLLPALAAGGRPASFPPVDWPVTAVVLGSVAAVLAISFAWHRVRRR